MIRKANNNQAIITPFLLNFPAVIISLRSRQAHVKLISSDRGLSRRRHRSICVLSKRMERGKRRAEEIAQCQGMISRANTITTSVD